MKNIWIYLLLTIGYSCGLQAQNDMTQSEALKIKSCDDFEVNGKGDQEVWNSTNWVQLNALKDAQDVYQTQVKVLYSDKGIYFLFWCQDRNITSTMTEDFSDLWNEDVVEVFLWTDEQYPIYFEYEISPLNFELPILVPKIGQSFLGWRPWHYTGERRTRHATHIQKTDQGVQGWTAEFFIPYDLMRPLSNIPPEPGTRWRANMYRIDYDAEKPVWWAWRPIVNNFHDNHLFGTFEFE